MNVISQALNFFNFKTIERGENKICLQRHDN